MKSYLNWLKTRSRTQWLMLMGWYVLAVLFNIVSGGEPKFAIVSLAIAIWVGMTGAYLIDTYL